jgi:hypothetical protein
VCLKLVVFTVVSKSSFSSNIKDVDIFGVPPPCFLQCFCGAKTQEHLQIKTTSDEHILELKLEKGTGQEVARMIKNQVEVMQRIERS